MDLLDHNWLDWWVGLMALALSIALAASGWPRRPLGGWLGDFFVRWGLAGLLVWFVVNGLWAVRELLGQKLVIPFAPFEGYLEHATVWSAVATGMATFLFLGSALLLRAIFEKGEAVAYIRIREVVATEDTQLEVVRTAAVRAKRKEDKKEAVAVRH